MDLIERVLSKKQQVFDQRVNNIQNKINTFQSLVEYLCENCKITDKQLADLVYYEKEMNKITNSMVDQNYNNIMNWLNEIISKIKSWKCQQ